MDKTKKCRWKITPAGIEDFWDVYNLYKTLMGSEPLFSEAQYRQYIQHKDKYICVAKDRRNRSLGLISWIIWPGALSFPLDICFVQDMIVLEDYRRKGLGKAMLEYVKSWALDNDIHILHLQTDDPDAVEFYKYNGFESRNTGLFCFIKS